MCGIAAAFSYSGRPLPDRFIADACSRVACRGPDGEGVWSSDDGLVSLGHRRLAIIDLSPAGAQPMRDPARDTVISFNGEIYNYRALREELEREGCRFRSHSDTEVLLELYSRRGVNMLAQVRGMFAFALWDGRERKLLLARDAFGIKPLYLADAGGAIYAASEVKSVLAASDVDRSPEPAGHAGFFLWGHVPEPYTLYRGIRAVPPGSIVTVHLSGRRETTSFASIGDLLRDADWSSDDRTPGELGELLRESLLDTVRHHLVADVPVGVFLSAGIDSALLTGLATETGVALRTVTLGFEEFRGTPNDETVWAGKIAEQYGSQHRTIWITRRDFQESMGHILARMDQPTIDGVNSYFVARAAASANLKVALSGLGGDELFAGYPSFQEIPRVVRLVQAVPARSIGRLARRITEPFLGRLTSPKYAGVLEYGGTFGGAYLLRRGLYMPWELSRVLDRDLAALGLEDLALESTIMSAYRGMESPRLRVSALEASLYMRNQLLRDTDWASMSHSIEVRVPFVDWTLWKRLAGPVTRGEVRKQDLASTVRPPLPPSLVHRPKSGFVTPVPRWIAEEMGGSTKDRGMRQWARVVYRHATGTT